MWPSRAAHRAQRGPGLASRQRNRRAGGGSTTGSTLNEGRDSRPGNGTTSRLKRLAASARSTRAGTRVPATASDRPTSGCAPWTTLNEGRDSRPGNGGFDGDSDPLAAPLRSTRAGTRVPATADGALAVGDVVNVAQRGPGLASRQRAVHELDAELVGYLAQRGPGLASRQRVGPAGGVELADQVRSTRAGTRVPATAGPSIGSYSLSGLIAQRGPGLASRQRHRRSCWPFGVIP